MNTTGRNSMKTAPDEIREALRSPLPDADLDAMAGELGKRAEEEGLLDVAYTETDSPFGRMLLAATPRGLVKLGLPNQDPEQVLEELARKVSPRVLEQPERLDEARRELDLYFDGKLHEFELPLDFQLAEGFRGRVVKAIAKIPYGGTATYTQMAKRAGNERAVRAAGTACGRNPIPIVVPCHRVLRSGGGLGGYGGGVEMKQGLLRLEGVLE
jgi:methylated-DNA-[protein]-cysteine S-methyltransferase